MHTRQLDEALTGKTVSGSNAYVSPAGVEGQYEYTFVPVVGADGQVVTIVGTTRDVTARLRAEGERAEAAVRAAVEEKKLAREREAVRAALHEIEELVRLSPVPMVVFRGPDHVYSLVNAAHDRMLRKRVVGKAIREAHTKEEGGQVPEILDRVYRTGEPFVSKAVHYSVQGEDGRARSIWVHEWFYPMRDMASDVVGVLGMAQDVTDEVRARGEVSTVLNAIPAFVTRVNTEGRFVFISQSNTKYFGPTEKILGRTMKEYYGADYDFFADKVDAALRGEQVEFEWASPPLDDGLVHHFIVNYSPERGHAGAVEGFVSCIFNIDALKEAETHLKAASVEADLQRNERAQLLERAQAARAEAESANLAKDEFLAMLGHELRNPLAPIMTALQLMRLRGSNEAERERAVIERQVKHLARLVDDLLDVSRITGGKVELARARLDIAEVVAKAIEMASPLIEQRQHTLSAVVPPGLLVDGDPYRLAQIVSNLLTNAAKYTPAGGRISITGAREGGDVVLRVTDNGFGIAPELLPRIFDLFVQGNQPLDRAQGGLGLGLAIVRRFVELHGGYAAVASEGAGRGSTFTVKLPAVEGVPAAPETTPILRAPATPNDKRVLVVDDNEDAAELLSEVLRALGYATQTAFDGPTALGLLETFKPDIALLDIGLPVMDGYELARSLRGREGLDSLRIVAVTGYGQQSDRQRALDAGFDALLVKPVDLSLLATLLEALPTAV